MTRPTRRVMLFVLVLVACLTALILARRNPQSTNNNIAGVQSAATPTGNQATSDEWIRSLDQVKAFHGRKRADFLADTNTFIQALDKELANATTIATLEKSQREEILKPIINLPDFASKYPHFHAAYTKGDNRCQKLTNDQLNDIVKYSRDQLTIVRENIQRLGLATLTDAATHPAHTGVTARTLNDLAKLLGAAEPADDKAATSFRARASFIAGILFTSAQVLSAERARWLEEFKEDLQRHAEIPQSGRDGVWTIWGDGAEGSSIPFKQDGTHIIVVRPTFDANGTLVEKELFRFKKNVMQQQKIQHLPDGFDLFQAMTQRGAGLRISLNSDAKNPRDELLVMVAARDTNNKWRGFYLEGPVLETLAPSKIGARSFADGYDIPELQAIEARVLVGRE